MNRVNISLLNIKSSVSAATRISSAEDVCFAADAEFPVKGLRRMMIGKNSGGQKH